MMRIWDEFIVWLVNCLLRLTSKEYSYHLTQIITLGRAAYEEELYASAVDQEYQHLSEALMANENP